MKALQYLTIAAVLAATGSAVAQTAAENYVARGNEPGWILTVGGKTMVLENDYGASKVEAIVPAQHKVAGGYSYATRASGQRLDIEVLNRLCRDDMSGLSFPDSVTVTLGERVLHGCGGDPAALLQHARWLVVSIDGKDVVTTDAKPSMVFETTGRVAGHASCNSYGGDYKLSGEGLSFGELVSTKRACAAPLMEQENALLAILRDAVRHEFADDGSLIIEASDGRTLTARKG